MLSHEAYDSLDEETDKFIDGRTQALELELGCKTCLLIDNCPVLEQVADNYYDEVDAEVVQQSCSACQVEVCPVERDEIARLDGCGEYKMGIMYDPGNLTNIDNQAKKDCASAKAFLE